MPDADTRILLSHTPDLLATAAAWDIDLMLSGHNHGGQIRLPVVGPILMPSRFSRRFEQGFYRLDRTLLYVGRGIGAKHPIRYGCMPEIARITLRVPSEHRHRARTPSSARKMQVSAPDSV
jgi:predicted MPP superfamily phosphohydrolase